MTNIFKHGMAFTWLVTEGTGYDRYFQSCENLNWLPTCNKPEFEWQLAQAPQIYQAFQHENLKASYKHPQLSFAPSSALVWPLLTQGKLSSSSSTHPCAGLQHQSCWLVLLRG